ncbi:AAA domain-containing protein [Campylobacter jejuni]|uniref:AAA domain-containing protein n=2 Tax=Campylobacter jejuni TaxID=197 RepID=A0A5T0GW27_CAMJU|nr:MULTISPECIES: AAA family ATPase [Campylobacter]ADN90366.1 McrBC restriction endonuclease system, McrB subunit, putative [Campylobacter jejuni subsp. jejuni M1]AII23885.1 AAA domain protein (dynein-related subfamily) [Campylobacter jejuni subsp. jejuni]ALK80771.1 5-methylcytosine-specific restriction enzyme B [Campylobacter jejuni]AXL28072.1 restriction endonuclease [Campylobacter jejuni]EAH4635469.1 restriction endonuclease [Campylobacter jejuni]
MTKIFSENNKKEIQDIFKKMIDLAMKFYNDRNSTFKDDIEDIQNFFESYEWKLYTGLQTLQKDKYKGFALYKEIKEEEYIKFKKGRSAWHGIYIWFGVSRDDIYMRIVAKEEEKCNALLKIQKDNILDYKLEEKIDKFEEIKDRLFDVFLYLSNYINNLSKDDFKIIKDYNMMKNNTPLNQILYGPPGTGKTYHTIDRALEIILKEEKIQIPSEDDRINRKKLFDEYVKNGQIVFTTFHQSYGYEEFIEGIKPRIDSEENSKEIKYEIKDGIFKELCEKALENRDSIKNFNFYIDKLKEKAKIDDNNPEKYFELPNTKYSIQYRNGKTFRIKFDDMSKNHKDYPVSIDNIEKLYKTSNIDEIYNSVYVRAILNYLKSQGLEDYKEKDEKTNLPYIIIIDEINRGNVSKIFGELITLIEPSKRIGEKEELKVILPYSKKEFGVPKNVYIIGTMNTADRSITSLDTALRRRFEFIEMMPDVSKLSMDCEGINLQELLKAINTRIEYLLDREKTIGHAFFIGVENLNDLKSIFQNKIIPLLQEYFYNDYALINAVLNDNGMIFEDKKDDKYLQKIKNLDSVNSERSIYNIASFDDKIWDKIEIYQAIYNDEIANKLKNENE